MSLHNLDRIHGDEHFKDDLSAREIEDRIEDFLSGHVKDAADILMDKVAQDKEVRALLLGLVEVMDVESKNLAILARGRQLHRRLNQLIKEMAENDEF